MELDTIEAVKQSVTAGHGVAIVPFSSVKKEIHLKLFDYISLSTNSICSISLIYSKEVILKEHIKDFINFVKKFGKDTFC